MNAVPFVSQNYTLIRSGMEQCGMVKGSFILFQCSEFLAMPNLSVRV